MTDLLTRYWPAIWQAVSPIVIYMLATGAANLLAHVATDAAWLARHPRWAGALKAMRAVGFSPQGVAQGVRLIASTRLPAAVQPLVGNDAPPTGAAPPEGPTP